MSERSTAEPACTKLNFRQLVQYVRDLRTAFSRMELERLFSNITVTADDYLEFMLEAEPYGRVSVVKNDMNLAELLIMTWKTGQESPIHDHFESACGIRVLQGTMTETMYEEVEEGKARKLWDYRWPQGSVSTSEASLDIHKVANADEGTLVTLHLYSVPLDMANVRRFIEVMNN